jgi:hypothetical protein
MRLTIGVSCIVTIGTIGLVALTAACAPTAQPYAGPGCLLYLYPLPGLAGNPLPVRADASDITSTWHETAASAKVVYGTWRLFSEPTFEGFAGDYKAPMDRVEFRQPLKIGSLKCIQLEPH